MTAGIGLILILARYTHEAIARSFSTTVFAQVAASVARNQNMVKESDQDVLSAYESAIRKDIPSIQFQDGIPLDRWSKKIRLEIDDAGGGVQNILVTSSGPDKIMGTSDDIQYSLLVDGVSGGGGP